MLPRPARPAAQRTPHPASIYSYSVPSCTEKNKEGLPSTLSVITAAHTAHSEGEWWELCGVVETDD